MKKLVLLMLLTTMISGVYSQKKIIYGKVDYVDYPVQNVIVSAKKSQASVTTDLEGKYVIACEKNDVLTFETTSFYLVKKRVRYHDTINVHLVIKPGVVNEENVIANHYLSPDDFKIALSKAENENNEYARYTDIFEVIRAKFPTAEIRGGGILLRGNSSFNNPTYAIYVVDGSVVRNVSHINPSTIKSIEILSSTESVIRYGGDSRGGAIVIKTKISN